MLDKADQPSLGRKLRSLYEAEPASPLPGRLRELIARLRDKSGAHDAPAESSRPSSAALG